MGEDKVPGRCKQEYDYFISSCFTSFPFSLERADAHVNVTTARACIRHQAGRQAARLTHDFLFLVVVVATSEQLPKNQVRYVAMVNFVDLDWYALTIVEH